MPSLDRRAAGRRRAWGRGPITLKLESLERRALMAAQASSPLPDLVNSSLTVSSSVSDWGGAVEVEGKVTNQGTAATTAPFEVAYITYSPGPPSVAMAEEISTMAPPAPPCAFDIRGMAARAQREAPSTLTSRISRAASVAPRSATPAR